MCQFRKQLTMNRTLIILSILLCSSCVNMKKSNNDKYATMMTIKFVDMDIETPMDIRSDNFEKYFPEIQTKVVNDSMKINQIFNTLKYLKIAGKEYYQHVDKRMKLEIKYNNDSIETICMDRFIINRNNQLLVNTDSLKYLLTWTE